MEEGVEVSEKILCEESWRIGRVTNVPARPSS